MHLIFYVKKIITIPRTYVLIGIGIYFFIAFVLLIHWMKGILDLSVQNTADGILPKMMKKVHRKG